MGAYGIIGFSQSNKLAYPSGSVWADNEAQQLLEDGSGYFDYKDFKALLPVATAPNWNIDSGTYTYNTHYDSVVSITTGGTTQDDAAIATRPLGPIIPGSGQKVWFEALVSVASVAAAKGIFVGVANAAALGSKLLISAASGTLATNTIGTASGGQSFYGFWMHGDAYSTTTFSGLGNFDIVWGNNVQSALTAGSNPAAGGTAGTIATNTSTTSPSGVVLYGALSANANNPNPANLGYTPPVPPGVLAATVTSNQTVAGQSLTPQQLLAASDPSSVPQTFLPNSAAGAVQFVKLGLRYDGTQYLYFYVNGTQVAKMLISAAQDVISDFAGVVQIMAGTGAANVLNVGFVRTSACLVP
jgi:hypothetical protein